MAVLAGPAPLPVQWRMSPGQWAPRRHSDVNGFSHIDLEVAFAPLMYFVHVHFGRLSSAAEGGRKR